MNQYTRDQQIKVIISASLVLVTVAVFWPVTHAGFVRFDDPLYVNEHVQKGLNVESIRWAFQTFEVGFWHPIHWLSLMLDAELFGPWAGGYHATNLLLHTLNTVLVFLLFHQMTGGRWRSAFLAALFALHPLHVESVAWIADRKDVLSTLFLLLTLMAYIRYTTCRSRREEASSNMGANGPAKDQSLLTSAATKWYVLALVCFALGLMSKPMLVTLPCLLLLLDRWPLSRWQQSQDTGDFARSEKSIWLRLVLEKVPFFALAIGASCLAFITQRSAGAVGTFNLPLGARIGNALVSYCRYLGKLCWPTNLSVFYPHPGYWPTWMVAGASFVLLGISLVAFLYRHQRPCLLVGWLWFLGTLVPAIGIVQVGEHAMADRYCYVPAIGFWLMIVWALPDLRSAVLLPRMVWGCLAGVVLVSCAVLSRKQLDYWRDTRTLFTHAVAVTRENATAQNNLGICLLEDGDFEAARGHFLEAIRISPKYASAYLNLADCCDKQDRLSEGIGFAQKALEIQPHPVCHFNLACLYLRAGNLDKAEAHLNSALKTNPDYVQARFNLGVLKRQQHRLEEATVAFTEVLRVQPSLGRAHNQLGCVLVEQRQWSEAILCLEAGLQSEPGDIEAHKSYGIALAATGRYREAEAQLQTVPAGAADAQTHYHLAIALHGQGQLEDALVHYREAVRLAPNVPDYLNDLAWLLATSPARKDDNREEPIRLAEKACELSGGKEARFWGTLDATYAAAGQFEQAIETAKKARELALAAGHADLAKAAEERMAFYQNHKPFRP